MIYYLKSQPTNQAGDAIIATALDGVVYSENNRVHIKTHKQHVVYKFDGAPVGWYARNLRNGDEIFLGVGASPTVALENLEIKSVLRWNSINQPQTVDKGE